MSHVDENNDILIRLGWVSDPLLLYEKEFGQKLKPGNIVKSKSIDSSSQVCKNLILLTRARAPKAAATLMTFCVSVTDIFPVTNPVSQVCESIELCVDEPGVNTSVLAV